jgi:hypothetical protein
MTGTTTFSILSRGTPLLTLPVSKIATTEKVVSVLSVLATEVTLSQLLSTYADSHDHSLGF